MVYSVELWVKGLGFGEGGRNTEHGKAIPAQHTMVAS